jgi:hypothetical protein
MPFDIRYYENEYIIESNLLGDFDWQVMVNMVPALAKQIKEKECNRVLLDYRSGKINLSTLKIYDTPVKLKEEFEKYGVNLFALKRVLLINAIDSDHKFFETVMLNQGQTLKIFLDKDSAIQWLIE